MNSSSEEEVSTKPLKKKVKVEKKAGKKEGKKKDKEISQKKEDEKLVSKQKKSDGDEDFQLVDHQISNSGSEDEQVVQTEKVSKKKGGKVEKTEKEKKGAGKQKKESKKDKKNAKVKQPLIKEDAESLLIYFKDTNRPFTMNFLKDTLHLKATQLQKNLDQLVKNGDITLKEIGSSKVYLYNQSKIPEVDPEQMDQQTQLFEEYSTQLKLLNNENNKIQEQIKQLLRISKLEEIEKEISDHQQNCLDIEQKIQLYSCEQFQKAPIEEINKAEEDYSKMSQIAHKRSQIYKRALDCLMENSEMSLQEFESLIGIQRD